MKQEIPGHISNIDAMVHMRIEFKVAASILCILRMAGDYLAHRDLGELHDIASDSGKRPINPWAFS